jgi:hypothetical protein
MITPWNQDELLLKFKRVDEKLPKALALFATDLYARLGGNKLNNKLASCDFLP